MTPAHSRLSLRARSRALTHATLLETFEPRILCSADIRSIDGTGNNLLNPALGAADAALVRLAAPQYADGISAPSGTTRPSARVISNTIADHGTDDELLSSNSLSAFAYLWGQFIDHDLDLTTTSAANGMLNVAVPTGDPQFDPVSTGIQVIPMSRSNFAPGTGVTSARQQVNAITAFLDGSMVYGSDPTRAAALRTFVGGKLLTSDGNMLPFNTTGLPNANDAHLVSDDQLFLAGDVRANENTELTSVQTLFVREHNRIATEVGTAHPTWTDEQIYQQARKLVIGEIQAITYNEFLPALLGPNAMPRYTGYNPSVNAGISNEFSAAAFRLGHSMLTDDVEFLNNDGTDFQDEMALSEVFFNPAVIESTGIDPVLKYLASSNSEEIDTKVVDSVRNFLFGPPGAGGLDLASLNIQRGRDHGLADYNTTRAAVGLPKVTTFSQITSDPELAGKLQQLYGNVNNVDLWVGGLAEDHVRGSNLGATFQKILVDQFTRTRAGDRFWYETYLKGSDLSFVKGTTLADVIKRNTGITNLQSNVFVFDAQVGGKVTIDLGKIGRFRLPPIGVPGITVQLVDGETSEIVDTVKTARDGSFTFDDMQVGTYTVQLSGLPSYLALVSSPSNVQISKGGKITGYNFILKLSPTATATNLASLGISKDQLA